MNTEFTDIIWIQTGFIGDIILNTAAISLIREKFPHVKQHIITTPFGKEIYEGEASLSCVSWDKRKDGLFGFKKIKDQLVLGDKPIILCAHRSFRTSILARYLGFDSIGYEEAGFSFLIHKCVPRVSIFHEKDRIGLLCEPLGIERSEILSSLPKLTPIGSKDFGIDPKRKKVLVAPGSVWKTKMWPMEYYAELAKRFSDANWQVILSGSKNDLTQCQFIANCVDVVNLCGKTSLLDLKSIFPSVDLVVANDSSPTHFASSFNIPIVTIFGATTPSLGFAPLSNHSLIVENSELGCRPCSDHGPNVCPLKHFDCMKKLSVDGVWQQIKIFLTKASLV